MEDRHRSAIQKNFTSLVEQTDLDMMVSALYERGVFSEQMIEPYKDLSKDLRSRKRQLYMDVTRRGPQAFGHLLDALYEAGYWSIVRDLDPDSALHASSGPRTPRRPPPHTSKLYIGSISGENNFVSISSQKKRTKTGAEATKSPRAASPAAPAPAAPHPRDLTEPSEIPQFHVVKSTKFYEDGHDIKLYRTRGRNRGVLVVFTYMKFLHNTASYRRGADVDCQRLKYLFDEMGFKVLSYPNLTRAETWNTLHSLKEVVAGVESVFIVVSSHGYPAARGSDIDIRCHDGQFISVFEIVDHFNNERFPALRGVPKVFIFQLCRGSNESFVRGGSDESFGRGGADSDGTPVGAAGATGPPRPPPPDRVTSDVLVAHSTTPGSVSFRDRLDGSWYIQALCAVFAARAHDCHVEKLFTLVDKELHKNFRVQTSAVEKWGFNCRLYLHPGLVEPDPLAP